MTTFWHVKRHSWGKVPLVDTGKGHGEDIDGLVWLQDLIYTLIYATWPDLMSRFKRFRSNWRCCLKVHSSHEHPSKNVAILCYRIETTALAYTTRGAQRQNKRKTSASIGNVSKSMSSLKQERYYRRDTIFVISNKIADHWTPLSQGQDFSSRTAGTRTRCRTK